MVPDCGFNAAVEIIGTVTNSPKDKQAVEIQATEIKVMGKSELKDFPFAPRKVYPSDYIRKFLHLRPKTNVQSSILRLSSQITTSLHSTLIDDGYMHTFTPVLTTNDCEGAGEVFLVKHASSTLKNESYFNEEVYLTVSGQLHLEALAGSVFKKIFKKFILRLSIYTGAYQRSTLLDQHSEQRTQGVEDIWLNLEC